MSKPYKQIRLVQTCWACPEQYDAYLGNKLVGYLRLRHGFFSVRAITGPDDTDPVSGDTVYTAAPRGDGIFESDERKKYLRKAKKRIYKHLISIDFFQDLDA